MLILFKILIFNIIFLTWGYSNDCYFTLDEINLNDDILAFYLNAFDWDNGQSQIDLFTINVESNCNQVINIEYTIKIYAPKMGLSRYETFYKAGLIKEINTSPQRFHTTDFQFISGPSIANNAQAEKLISYISQSGKLPNGKYLFQFVIKNADLKVLSSKTESIEINRPQALDLLSPGGRLSEMTESYTFSTVPIFTWYSDVCIKCKYGIRVCKYNQDEHSSLQDALADWSLLPWDQSNEYYELEWNMNSFQYPVERHMDLQVGQYYVWQIRRTYNTTLEAYHDYSPIYVFEIRSPSKKQLDFSDPYLSAIQSLVGEEQFNLWFSSGGELERFTTRGESIWINNEELHIDALFSLSSELKQGKIKLEQLQLK
jgi:hypothetical protein